MELQDLFNALEKKCSNAEYNVRQATQMRNKNPSDENMELVIMAAVRLNTLNAALEELRPLVNHLDVSRLIELRQLENTVRESVSNHDTVEDWMATNRNFPKYRDKWEELITVLRGWVNPSYIGTSNVGWNDACTLAGLPHNYTFDNIVRNNVIR